MSIAAIRDPDLLPYGVFVAERASVIYDRKYRPIVRVPGQWPDCDSASATVVDPTEWVTHDRQEWFYNDGNIPRRNKHTRERLQGIVDKIPALASEIERRDRAAERADKAENNDRLKCFRVAQLSPTSQAKLEEWKTKREARRLKRLDRYFDLDDAGYAKWVAAGLPYSDTKKVERWTERRFREHLEKSKAMNDLAAHRNQLRDAAQSELDAFEGVATQAELDGWRMRHALVASEIAPATVNIVTSERFLETARKEAAEVNETVRARRFDAASLDGKPVPERDWYAPGLIPGGNVTLVFGDGGTGKSLLLLQLGVAGVAGGHFFGRPVKKGPIEFITAEDSKDEIHRRLVDICRTTGTPLASLSDLHITSLVDADALLAREGGDSVTETPLYRKVQRILAESKPKVLVLDTLADTFGGNENVRSQARRFISMLRHLAIENNCAIVVLARPSLAGMEKGTSGNTGWNNSVRSRLYFARVLDQDGTEPDEDLRVLRVMKSNYGRVGTEIHVRYKNGVFVEEGGAAGPDPLAQRWKAERVFLELLDKANKHHAHVSSKKGANYAPAVFAREALKQGVKKRDLVDVMNHLLDSGKIENTPHGSPSRMRYWLERVSLPPSESVFPPSLPPSLPPTLPPSSTM